MVRNVYRMAKQTLTPHEIRVVAAAVGCDPRTVRRYLAGGKTRMMAQLALEKEIAHLKAQQQSKAS